uniref:Coiled-coil domain-containing protein 15 isoform X1 n=1 Tax=Pogona vitticeps TaxID=103695 RepID=A0ABM5EP24_9SAUR
MQLSMKQLQQQQCYPWRTADKKGRGQSVAVSSKVLAERTQFVAPVGAWVESAQDDAKQEESPVFATAAQIEEEYKNLRKEKERILKHFQEEVKHRVNQRVKQRRKQQLQKSYEAALKESSVVIGFSDSALQLTPKKSTCLYRCSTDSAICRSGSRVTSVQESNLMIDGGEKAEELKNLEQAKTVRKTVQQAVRRRLASRKSVSEKGGPLDLPGGIWDSLPKKELPGSCKPTSVNAEEGDRHEFLLVGYHDLPAQLRNEEQGQQRKEVDYTVELKKVNSEILKSTYPVSSSATGTENRPAWILWSETEKEESKKQRQSQYLRYRRLFMDIEREQVKEQQRQKEWQRKMDKIKKEKEQERHAEEQRIQERHRIEKQRIQEQAAQRDANSGVEACAKLDYLRLEDAKEKKKVVERQQRNKEYGRYVEALRAQMQEKIKMYNINLPPLCFCGSDFWDSHPDSCANNCVFYKNHKAYAQALQSVISSCNILDGGSNTRLAIHTFATIHAHSKNS